VTSYRERDVRELIHDVLEDTGVFDGVYLCGLPEDRGEPSGHARSASIEPGETVVAAPWDDTSGDLLMTCRVNLMILARDEDARIRDETAELLLNVAANAINGQALSGLSLSCTPRIRSWSWQKPKAPERRIAAVLEYQYLIGGWAGANTDE
jgi:hypothetical protein